MTSPSEALFDAVKSPLSPRSPSQTYTLSRSPRASHDSDDDSLRDLELSEGPLLADGPHATRTRAYSISGFDFQHDLLPLTASLSEPESLHEDSHAKNISLVNGAYCKHSWSNYPTEWYGQALHLLSGCRLALVYCEQSEDTRLLHGVLSHAAARRLAL